MSFTSLKEPQEVRTRLFARLRLLGMLIPGYPIESFQRII